MAAARNPFGSDEDADQDPNNPFADDDSDAGTNNPFASPSPPVAANRQKKPPPPPPPSAADSKPAENPLNPVLTTLPTRLPPSSGGPKVSGLVYVL